MKSKKTVKKPANKPKKEDFILNEKELEKVAGGVIPNCGDIGMGGSACTKTGMGSGCTEIGVFGENCTKAGF
ncbi:MAG: hypothetical protein WCO93_05280 [bacterium]